MSDMVALRRGWHEEAAGAGAASGKAMGWPLRRGSGGAQSQSSSLLADVAEEAEARGKAGRPRLDVAVKGGGGGGGRAVSTAARGTGSASLACWARRRRLAPPPSPLLLSPLLLLLGMLWRQRRLVMAGLGLLHVPARIALP